MSESNKLSLNRHRLLLWAAGTLFLLSGAASLVYEVAWVKMLTQQFGSSAWSISTVLAGFMAGLGGGSFLAGRYADRIRRPLRVYALLELGIAAFGLISVPLFHGMGAILGLVYGPLEGHFAWFVLFQFLLAFVILVVPTALMGASLPVLVMGLAAEKTFGRRVALLYGINTLGAAAGTVGAGIIALPVLGISGTIWAAAVLGLLVAGGAFLLDGYVKPSETVPEAKAPSDSARPPRLLIASAVACGCLSIFYQVAWTRLLIPVVGSSTYAFTIILTTFLLGIGIGGLLPAVIPALHRAPYRISVGVAMALTSVSVLVGLGLVNGLPGMFFAMAGGSGQLQILLSQGALAGSLILVPTIGMGAALPLAIAGWQARTKSGGKAIGGIYAANTFAAIAGSILAGFVFVSWLGAAGSIRLAAALGLVVAAVLVLSDLATTWRSRIIWSGVMVLALAFLQFALPSVDFMRLHGGVFRDLQEDRESKSGSSVLLDVREGRNATVLVERSPQHTALRVNGKVDATTMGDLSTQYLVGHIPMVLHERPRDVCVVGYGSGATAYAVTTHPTIRSVDVVELEPAVLDVSKFFESVNYGVMEDPRVRVHVEDARTFLRYREDMYDVIISEPSNPWMAGVSALFTSEYYRRARARLKPSGYFCQWVQFYEISDETLRVMLHTLASEFPHVLVFFINNDLICVASEEPIAGDFKRFTERLAVPRVKASLDRIDIKNPYDMFGLLLRTFPEEIDLFKSRIKNTEDNLWLEYRAPLEMYQDVNVSLKWLSADRYIACMQRLFPDVSRGDIALGMSRAVLKIAPRLSSFVAKLAEEFDDEKLAGEIRQLSKLAAERNKEMEKTDERLIEANELLGKRSYAECVPILEEVIKHEPRNGMAHRALGWCLLNLGEQVQRAVNHHLKAIEIQPDDYVAQTNLAAISFNITKMASTSVNKEVIKRGEKYVARALELNPHYAIAWKVLLKHLAKSGKSDEARSRLREAERMLTEKELEALKAELEPLLP